MSLSAIARYFDFSQQHECDQQLHESTLHLRDRKFALNLGETLPDALLLSQWHKKRAAENPRPETHNWQHRHHLYIFFLCFAGLLGGYAIAKGVLFYDGQHPINLITVISVLIFLQLIILGIFAITCLPFMGRIKHAFSIVNPALWMTRLIDKLSQNKFAQPALSHLNSVHKIEPSILFSYFLYLAQYFAIAFNVGVLSCLLFLVFSSDLAFGWNTTLQINDSLVHQIIQLLSLPWQSWYAQAVPTLDLVEISRYYRLDDALSNRTYISNYAEQLGQWWKFIALCVLFYGLLPRLILFIYLKRQFTNQVQRAIIQHPYSQTLLARMRTPKIDTVSHESESQLNKQDVQHRALRPELNLNMTCPVLLWSNASITSRELKKFGITASQHVDIGGNFTPLQDKQALRELTATDPKGVVVVCKGWEAPTYDLMDTIELTRKLLKNNKKTILVLLSSNSDIVLSKDQIDCWETMFNEFSFPNVYVEAVKIE